MDPQKRILTGIVTQAMNLRSGEICTIDSVGRPVSRQEQLRRQHLERQQDEVQKGEGDLEKILKEEMNKVFIQIQL